MKNPNIELESLERTRKLVETMRFCMMTTATAEGRLVSRPMTALEMDAEGYLWFFASTDADQTVALDSDDSVNLAFADPNHSKYLSISGSAEVAKDRAKIEALWNSRAAAWFPEGKDDPELCLIKVRPIGVEYWEGPAKAVELFGVAKAILTRSRYDNGGEHAKLI